MHLPTSRRTFLNASTAAAVGSFWGGMSQALAAQPKGAGKAKSVILIFNCGGPSHIDLWDPKPAAGDTIRGEFSTINSSVPGIQVSSMLPRMAERMKHLAIVRSVHHQQSSHNAGMYNSVVGRPYSTDSTLINPAPTDYPSIGTLCGWLALRDGYSKTVPPYVITPYPHCDSTVYLTPGQYGGCLGIQYDPFVLDADPNAADFRVRNLRLDESLTPERLDERRQLLARLGSAAHPVVSPSAADLDARSTQAAQMIATGEAAKAFDLTEEPEKAREKYGRHQWGQSHLLARRLVESGSRFVTTVNGRSIIWDTHADNFPRLKNNLVPPMEIAYAALLDDLQERGLLDSTLVVWMGDFGRTPTINKGAGRDHWPGCYSMVLAGGGIRGGQVIGESDKQGAYPHVRPITPADIHATIFAALGYDPRRHTYLTTDGRPTPLTEGEPIKELLG